ncbi:tyrosine-type recombinase/integrase [Deinococcus pimensis]|uniref:tyrosine-type recombinase/integrase n=1 Tax=Deinococcus pimensis TaxID=309888 RepID=UPI00069392FD|nr:site-specific integrase [Deinococcus pimensis]
MSVRGKVFQHLRAAFEEAIEQELIAVNPARAIRIKATAASEDKRERATDKALSEDEMLRFLAAASGDAMHPLLYLMFSLGVRRGEALGLRWRDVDFTTGAIRITQQAKTVKNSVVISPLKTKGSRRTLDASPDLLDVLRERRQTQHEQRDVLGDAWTDMGLVFTTSLGTPIHPRNVNRSIDRLCKLAGVRHFSSHAARHTMISNRLREGEKLEVVSVIAGHARPSITSDLYRTVFEDEKRAAVYSIAELQARKAKFTA